MGFRVQNIGCAEGQAFLLHYYPGCPELELTLGASKHSDPNFFTILLQDHIGGLQVLRQRHWRNVTPIKGALVVNIGDLLQLVSNGKFKSVEHKVIANPVGPRISIACFFIKNRSPTRMYGPIKELLTEDNPPISRRFLCRIFFFITMERVWMAGLPWTSLGYVASDYSAHSRQD